VGTCSSRATVPSASSARGGHRSGRAAVGATGAAHHQPRPRSAPIQNLRAVLGGDDRGQRRSDKRGHQKPEASSRNVLPDGTLAGRRADRTATRGRTRASWSQISECRPARPVKCAAGGANLANRWQQPRNEKWRSSVIARSSEASRTSSRARYPQRALGALASAASELDRVEGAPEIGEQVLEQR
jgi:hypothetical protein